MKRPAEEKSKRSLGEKINDMLDLPKDFIKGRVSVSLNSNTSCFVEGSKGILEYTDEIVRILTEGYMIVIKGKNLELGTITTEYVNVTGTIISVEYVI